MQRTFAGAIALQTFFFAAAAFATDTLQPGFELVSSTPNVYAFDAYATLADGRRVRFDGNNVDLETAGGSQIATLFSIQPAVFTSFVAIAPDETFALVGESSNGKIYRVSLASGGAELCDLDLNFALAFEDANHALVSAGTPSFTSNEIHRVDLTTGATTKIAELAGPSGPLDVDAAGNLFYCTQSLVFPPPPGSSSVLRWTSAQTHSGTVLTEADATTFVASLDGGSSLRVERKFGHLFLTETPFGAPTRLREFTETGAAFDVVVESTDTLTGIEFHYGAGAASFQAFQPQNVTLVYRSTDYTLFTSTIQTVVPKRPTLTLSGPGLTGPGVVHFNVAHADPNASVFVISGPIGTYAPAESAFDVGDYLLHTGIPFPQIRRAGVQFATDSTGAGTYVFTNPGTLQGTRVLQVLVRNASGEFVGSSTAAFL